MRTTRHLEHLGFENAQYREHWTMGRGRGERVWGLWSALFWWKNIKFAANDNRRAGGKVWEISQSLRAAPLSLLWTLPPASLPVRVPFILAFYRLRGWEKNTPPGKQAGSTCTQNKGVLRQLLWRLTCSASSLGWVQFSALHSVWLSRGKSSSHSHRTLDRMYKIFTAALNTFLSLLFLTLLLTVNLDVGFGILTDTIQATGLQLTQLAIKLTSFKVTLISSDSLSLL